MRLGDRQKGLSVWSKAQQSMIYGPGGGPLTWDLWGGFRLQTVSGRGGWPIIKISTTARVRLAGWQIHMETILVTA